MERTEVVSEKELRKNNKFVMNSEIYDELI